LRVIIAIGKFHGVIAATTPIGCLMTTMRLSPACLGEPLDERRAIDHFASRLGQRLALLAGHQPGEILLVRELQVEPAAQDCGALLGRLRTPRRPGGLGGGHRTLGLGRAQVGHFGQECAVRRVGDREPGTVVGTNPGTVDERVTAQQGIGFVHALLLLG
jgi:hypothetical protein